jgi:putative DNA primase/helicase
MGFFILDQGVWHFSKLGEERTAAHVVAHALRDAVKEIDLREKPENERPRWRQVMAYAKHAQTTRGIDAMVRELRALQGVPISLDAFDSHHDLLAVRNGVVDLKTGALLPHDPALLLTRRIDVDYRPEATAPLWLSFLSEVFTKHPDLPNYMQRLIGYGITGRTDEQCFAVLYGTGANGKSVFTDTLTEVFRDVTTTTPFSTFEQKHNGGIPNDIAALKGARLVMASEGEQGRPMAEALLKRVTGRDMITARFLQREFFEFRPTFLLLMASNFKPNFRSQDQGLWRRVKLIPWDRFFLPEERDHHLGRRLLEEREGIFAWAVAGAVEWYKRGLQDPAVIVEGTREYRETSDPLTGFFEHTAQAANPITPTDSGNDLTVGSVLWDSYIEWADVEALPLKERWTRQQFFREIEARGFPKVKTMHGVGFRKIRNGQPKSVEYLNAPNIENL